MKHIQLFEDFKILKEAPKWFYLVLRFEKAWDSLLKMEFNGVVGISDNPEIINSWFDVRDTLLIMRGDEFLKLNPNVHKVNYDNPNQLVSNNFKLLNRLLQNSEDRKDFYDVCQKIFSHTERIKTTKSNEKKINTISYFLNQNLYKFENIVEDAVKKGKIINSVWDFVNVLWDNLDFVIDHYNKNYSYRKPYHKDDFDKNTIYYVIQQGILSLAQHWKKEGEWIIKKDKISGVRHFKVPMNSKLYFKVDVTDPEELKKLYALHKGSSQRGMREENIKLVTDLIESYELDKLYDIEFIEGHLKAFDKWKDEPIPETIPYSRLMKNIKGFPKPKLKKKPLKKPTLKKVA